ncbi:hypothetical protein JTE90_029355 [Oedothorax gibbosus]|uniref:Uncharacterized protein n=1 Tax=Oedothorax gibbosus TaxID=931172 RepID=A0AAV6UFH7_9ARAC|nr:hypothetical protein JTE90_029355 [Oedothorax gibbosus]
MKSGNMKSCPGSRLYFDHDSSGCVQCSKIKYYYEEFQPLVQQLKKGKEEVKVFGIITFLTTWVKSEKSPGEETLFGLFSKLDMVKDSAPRNTKRSNAKWNKDLKKLVSSCSSNLQMFFKKYHECFYNFTGAKIEDVSGDKIELGLAKMERGHTMTPTSRKETGKTMNKSRKRKASSGQLPTRGSMKRRRLLQENLSKRNELYTDDIFDENIFYSLNNLDDETSSNSSDYSGMETPTWDFSLSPRASSPTPSEELPYTVDISVEKLKATRRNAEVYQHRRRKKRNDDLKDPKKKNIPVVTAKELGASCSYTIENIYKMENPLKEEEDYDSEEVQDDYGGDFSDNEV